MPLLPDLLQDLSLGHPELYAWQVTEEEIEREQRLFLGQKDNRLELTTVRSQVTERALRAELLVRRGNATGRAELTLDPASPLREQLLAGLNMAALNSSPYYDLPAAQTGYPEVELMDPGAVDLPRQALRIEEEASRLLEKEEPVVKVNAAELFLERRKGQEINSSGLQLATSRSKYYFEIALERKPLPNTIEVHNVLATLAYPGPELQAFVAQAVAEAQAGRAAVVPPTTGQATVLLPRDAINQIMHALVYQLDAAREYHRQSHTRPGDILQPTLIDGERLNLAVDPFLPLMAESRRATAEGLCPLSGPLVVDGVVTDRFVSHRMSQYLSLPVRPLCGNLMLSGGSADFEDRLQASPDVYEIISFSSLLVNTDQLTWSSEIKLGRWLKYGKEHCMLKGGVVSGSLRENLQASFFSSDHCSHNLTGDGFGPPMGYRGPARWLVEKGVSVVG